ncbi:MAG: 4Fe-4S double cluster binding domain-containing protein [Bacillota bacterium]
MEKVSARVITTESLKRRILEFGATLVGFGDVSVGLAPELKYLSRAISIAVRHHPVEIIKTPRVVAYSNQLTAIDKKLEEIQKTVVCLMREQGYKCLAIPPDSLRSDNRFIARLYPLFPHKTAATCSGLGWIGKSGLLVNEEYGPRLSWATVLTNAPLEVSQEPYYSSNCGSCKNCVKICPVKAIEDRLWVRGKSKHGINYDRCSQHLERNKKVLGKAVCGLCIIVCPKGRDNC